ncbi:MAG: hypothetical protein IKG79_05745, partial [Neisseriaceae bacterium]|nr:hypothetical protein [Neisseriaceae bacterium]
TKKFKALNTILMILKWQKKRWLKSDSGCLKVIVDKLQNDNSLVCLAILLILFATNRLFYL